MPFHRFDHWSVSAKAMFRQLAGKGGYTGRFQASYNIGKGMLEHDLVFPQSYEVEGLPELPGSGKFGVPVLYFPPPKNRPDHNGLWLKVVPATGESWIGVFKFLFDSPRSFSRVVSTPDPNRVCVISGSAGYLVEVENP